MSEIKASPLELKLLLKLLDINKQFLSPEYHPEKERFEERFQTSVIFPIAPLGFEALASLNSDPGCAVCGKKQVKRSRLKLSRHILVPSRRTNTRQTTPQPDTLFTFHQTQKQDAFLRTDLDCNASRN